MINNWLDLLLSRMVFEISSRKHRFIFVEKQLLKKNCFKFLCAYSVIHDANPIKELASLFYLL